MNVPAQVAAIEAVELARIRADQRAQPRENLNTDIVESYALEMADGAEFPPLTVFHDGKVHWLADGFHREAAARMADLKEFPCEVHKGGLREAILHSCGANTTHGYRRSDKDKRRAVLRLLEDEEWGKWSDREIARQCAVDHKTVARTRADLKDVYLGKSPDTGRHTPGKDVVKRYDRAPVSPNERKVQRGDSTYTMDTAAIGKNGGKKAADNLDIPKFLKRDKPERRVVREEPAPVARPGQGPEAICGRVQEAIATLSGLPPAASVAEWFRGTDLAILVDERLTEAVRWLDNFYSAWGDSNADQD